MRTTAAIVLLALLPGCNAAAEVSAAPRQSTDAVEVVAAFYPPQFLAERLIGAGSLSTLSQPGVEPHDLELTPGQVAGIASADLVLYHRGLQPQVDEAVEQQAAGKALDLAAATPLERGLTAVANGELGEDEAGLDPHVWLDPTRMKALAGAVAARLTELTPGDADGLARRAAALDADLTALDGELRAGLTGCRRKDIVTSHNAFGYLARAYGLRQVAVTGLTPEDEPTPRRLAEVQAYAKANGVTTIFFEETVSPRVAEALARDVGAKAARLSPLESAPDDGDYLTAMRANLTALRAALDCPA